MRELLETDEKLRELEETNTSLNSFSNAPCQCDRVDDLKQEVQVWQERAAEAELNLVYAEERIEAEQKARQSEERKKHEAEVSALEEALVRANAETEKLRKRHRKSEEERKAMHYALLQSKQKHDEEEELLRKEVKDL